MINVEYIQWLEMMIEGCDDLGGMEREKAIYQNCLKKARSLGQTLPIQNTNSMLQSAVEFGYKQCEKGHNIQNAMVEWDKSCTLN